jgi:hypothetical protein
MPAQEASSQAVKGAACLNAAAPDAPAQVWYTLLSGKCTEVVREQPLLGVPEKGRQAPREPQRVRRRLVADVGANFGYYSLYAAAHGCRRALITSVLLAACLGCPYADLMMAGDTDKPCPSHAFSCQEQ